MADEKKMVECKHCGAQIAAGAKVCPQCGGKNKKPIYKRIWFILLIIFIVFWMIGSFGGDDTQNDKTASQSETETVEPAPEIEYIPYDVGELSDDLDANALKAADKYDEQYVELTGKLSVIDSDGQYISIVDSNDPYAILGVHCNIQNQEQKDVVMELNIGDMLVVKGQITDVGEIMAYTMDIDELRKEG